MADTIRCFIAIDLPDELKNEIYSYITKLKAFSGCTKWVNAHTLHLTLKFLGEQPSEKVDALIHEFSLSPPITKTFQQNTLNLGAFPNKNKPRILWLGTESSPDNALLSLKKWIDFKLEPLGYEPDTQRFKPHLTLARVKIPEDFAELWNFVQNNPFPTQVFPVEDIVLMKSILKPSGAEYRILHKFALKK